MKKCLLLSATLMISVILVAQPNKTAATPNKNSTHLKVFYQAATSFDYNTAIMALNYYIAEQGNNTPYADTLAMLYMRQGAYLQSLYWAELRLRSNPENVSLLEVKGVSLDKLEQPKDAIVVFEKLYGKTQSPFYGYKLMELQYSLKRLLECDATANSAEKLTYKPEYVMSYDLGQQGTRNTYLQAMVYNIHGLALYDMDRKAEAKGYFAKAISLDSNFVLARQNFDAMSAAEKAPQQKPNPNNSNNSNTPNNPANKN
ncbi:MAG TPA: hypothetical protein VKH37_03155 [Ferruginibacter sp.]|nr:hypothetical protein [Ferruginibacter sp.]